MISLAGENEKFEAMLPTIIPDLEIRYNYSCKSRFPAKIADPNPVGTANSNANEPIKKVGFFCCIVAVLTLILAHILVTLHEFVN